MNIEVLIAKDCDTCFEVVDTGYLDEMSTDSSYVKLKASYLTIQQVKKLLSEGKVVKVPKEVEWPELRPSDLIVETLPPLDLAKKIAFNNIVLNMHQNVLGICVLDMMDYLDCYMKLMAGGIFITDQNREDKYFEIIEKAQSVELPKDLGDSPTFEEEQQYMLKKQEYDAAQQNLQTLEKYLNAYDKLRDVKFVNDLLANAKEEVIKADSEDKVAEAVDKYKKTLQKCRNSSLEDYAS